MSAVDVVYPRIDAALASVADEIEVAEEEATAFRAFRSRLDRLEPIETTTRAGGGSLVAATSVAGVDPGDVRTAYRDTVMATAHYERDYGEPLLDNVGAEFGPAVRELLGGEDPIPPVQLGAVEAAVEQALVERRQFRRALEAERDSLESVAGRLGEIERELHEWRRERGEDGSTGERAASVDSVGFGSVRAERLRALADACESLATERQRSIHGGPASTLSGIGDTSLVEYLYGEGDHRFPALVEVADVAERVDEAINRGDR